VLPAKTARGKCLKCNKAISELIALPAPALPDCTAPLCFLKAERNICANVWICPSDDGLVCNNNAEGVSDARMGWGEAKQALLMHSSTTAKLHQLLLLCPLACKPCRL
jgi:hypothetical protein